jgi:O-antigen/teichoic acid export membrane protein
MMNGKFQSMRSLAGLRAYVSYIIRDDFMRHNAVFLVGSLSVAALNYLYHPILSRLLSIEDFGEVQAILSLVLQSGIILTAFGTVALSIIAETTPGDERRGQLTDLQSFAVYLVGTLAVALFFARHILSASFHFHSPLPFIVLAAILVVSVIQLFRRSYLQAKRDFTTLSSAGLIIAGGKLLCAVLLVLMGMRSFGAIAGYFIAALLSLIYLTKKTGKVSELSWTFLPRLTSLKRELPYGLLTLAALGFVTFLSNGDIAIAKYAFDPQTAGIYSGISVVASIIFFATASVSGVLLASVRRTASRRDNTRTLLKSFALVFGIGGATLLVFAVFPNVVIKLMLGTSFLPLAHLLPRLALVAFFASLVNLLFSYHLALRSYPLVISVTVGIVTLAITYPATLSPETLITAFLASAVATAVCLLLLSVYTLYTTRPKSP